jgi:hypothetical protein
MWKRIKRVVNSNLGRFSADPISGDAPRRADLDELGESLEVVKRQVTLLGKDLAALDAEEAAVSTKIRAALDSGDRDAATGHAGVLARVRDSKQRVKIQLEAAQSLCARAEGVSRDLHAPELDAAADETLARVEAMLQSEGKIAAPAREADERPVAKKTLGDDSGPVPEVASRSGKSIGGSTPSGVEARPGARAKTIGGMDEQEPEPKASQPAPKATEPKTEAPEADGPRDLVAELERLALLLDKGILNTDEFEQAKKKLLS